jgi:hypothetical protein
MPDWNGLELVLDHTDYALIGKCDAENGQPERSAEHPELFRRAYLEGYWQAVYTKPYLEPDTTRP